MTLNRKSIRALEKRLKKARPKLIAKAKNVYDPLTATCQCEIHSEVQKNGIELGRVVQEGFDPHNSPLGPVYWRVVERDGRSFYLSVYETTPLDIERAFGAAALKKVISEGLDLVACVETELPPDGPGEGQLGEGHTHGK